MRIVSACIVRVSRNTPPCASTQRPNTDASVLTEADEAYMIGKRGQYTPVQAYLAIDEIVKIAVLHGVNMIHPGEHFPLDDPTHPCGPLLTGYRLWFPL